MLTHRPGVWTEVDTQGHPEPTPHSGRYRQSHARPGCHKWRLPVLGLTKADTTDEELTLVALGADYKLAKTVRPLRTSLK